jgi:Uma2 family endonuclease
MSAMTTLPLRPDGWTVDDLGDLPDDGLRYELVDGALLVTPPPDLGHDDLAGQIAQLLAAVLPPHLRVTQVPGVTFGLSDYRQPDVVVYPRSAVPQGRLTPADVVLAVEVVSPSSQSTDRVTKPAQYAAAGIGRYWRVERHPLVLMVHALDGDVYRETGRFDDEVVVDEPVTLRFRLADLLP